MDKRFRIQGRTEAAYWSTLSGILGYWLPTPTEVSRGKEK
jgi:hypothetical protein